MGHGITVDVIISFLLKLILLSPSLRPVAGTSWSEWWTYDGISGPGYWGKIHVPYWQLCDKGKYQSPINIDPKKLLYDPNLGELKFIRKRISGKLINNGREVKFMVNNKQNIENLTANPIISGGALTYRYLLNHVSFHFGHNDTVGSEHIIANRAFPIELQFVAFNSDLFPDFTSALGSSFGVAIVTLLGQISDRSNRELHRLFKDVLTLRHKGKTKDVKDVSLEKLLPNITHYMTYEGSMTQPGCQEGVTWIVMNKPIRVSKDQLRILRGLYKQGTDGERGLARNNFRPTLALNRRTVRTNIPPLPEDENCKPKRTLMYEVNKLFRT